MVIMSWKKKRERVRKPCSSSNDRGKCEMSAPCSSRNSLQETVYQIHEALRDRAVEFLRLCLLRIQPRHNMAPSDRLGHR